MARNLPLSNQISIGGLPDEQELRTLAAEGVRSIVNLVPAGEDPKDLTPEEEGRLVQLFGMRYLYVPVPAGDVRSPQRVDEFLKGLERLPRPVHVHCRGARRAGIYSAIALGVEQGLSGELAVQHVRQLGFDPGSAEMADFIKNQVNEYQDKTLKG
jgi:protein tyrosine phosphatase (PTP) superfamily phosphohydrolase (DUF442 family)